MLLPRGPDALFAVPGGEGRVSGGLEQILHQLEVGLVVLDDQNARRHGLFLRQHQGKGAALAVLALHLDPSLQSFGELPAQMQAEPGALVASIA